MLVFMYVPLTVQTNDVQGATNCNGRDFKVFRTTSYRGGGGSCKMSTETHDGRSKRRTVLSLLEHSKIGFPSESHIPDKVRRPCSLIVHKSKWKSANEFSLGSAEIKIADFFSQQLVLITPKRMKHKITQEFANSRRLPLLVIKYIYNEE